MGSAIVSRLNNTTSPQPSSLVTYTNRLTSSFYSSRVGQPNCVTVHIACQTGTIEDLAKMLNSYNITTYNYGIDSDGVIGLFVDENMATNATHDDFNDNRSVNIVCVNDKLAPDYSISESCFNSLVNLCADIYYRHSIDKVVYTNNSQTDNITKHSQFNSSVNCPGPYLSKKWGDLVNRINSQLKMLNSGMMNGSMYSNYFDPSMMSMYNSMYGSSMMGMSYTNTALLGQLREQSLISMQNTKPYVAKIDAKVKNLDYKMLEKYGVLGIMLDAGQRYDPKHRLVDYRNERIYSQTEDVLKAGFPHAYIYTTRARNEDEVREEAYWLYFVVSKYPPKLGIWLHCEFDVTSSTAKKLVDKWYDYFVEWGLKAKCGLYCTKKQADLVGWPEQSTYMLLWLEGDLQNARCPDEEILVPSFFKIMSDSGSATNLMMSSYNTRTGSGMSYTLPSVSSAAAGDPNYLNPSTNKYGADVDGSTYKAVQTSVGVAISVPKASNYTGTKKYEFYSAITNKKAPAYKVCNAEGCTTVEGFRKLDDCFLIAVGSGICTAAGTYIDVLLANGTTIHCIMDDAKADAHTDDNTHVYTCVNKNYCCTEFIVGSGLPSAVSSSGDCSKYLNWNSPVVSMIVYNRNWGTEHGVDLSYG